VNVYVARRAAAPYRDPTTGAVTWTRSEDEVEDYQVDLTDMLLDLAAGTTISSVAQKAGTRSGVTIDSATVATNLLTVVVSHGIGSVTIIVTFSDGTKREIKLAWLPPEGNLVSDVWS